MLVQADVLRRLVSEIFLHAGSGQEEAGRIGHYLVDSNLAGHDSHGVIRVPRYVQMLRDGRIHANRTIKIVRDTDVLAVVDGQFGFGQSIAPQAVQLGIDKAKKHGVAIVALRNTGHIGRVGNWGEMAAEAGLVSVHFVNAAGSILVAPFGGTDRRFSTAPFCVGVPRPGDPPLLLDFATSVVAEGKVLVAAKGGKPVPPGSLIDENGNLSTDPIVLYGPAGPDAPPDQRNGKGAIRAMGEHKGSGVALMCEILGGALTGNGTAGPGSRQFSNGMLSIYIAPDLLGTDDFFAAEMKQYVDFVKSANPATPGGEVLVPGEPERRTAATRSAEGIPLTDEVWQSLLETARKVGIGENSLGSLVQ